MDLKTIYDVDIASDIKAFVKSTASGVKFADPALRDRIASANDGDLLRVGMTIGSPITIVSVDKVDADYFRAHLFSSGERLGN